MPFHVNTGGGVWQLTVGGVASIFIVRSLSVSVEAPVFAGVIPSLVVQTTSWVPSADSVKEPRAG